ncbi:MAG TPA: hypothetical protein VFG10_17630 [Saprospiraceae bacterium]|nr:hypothetical protein [Saprospiraceae bacterium]
MPNLEKTGLNWDNTSKGVLKYLFKFKSKDSNVLERYISSSDRFNSNEIALDIVVSSFWDQDDIDVFVDIRDKFEMLRIEMARSHIQVDSNKPTKLSAKLFCKMILECNLKDRGLVETTLNSIEKNKWNVVSTIKDIRKITGITPIHPNELMKP